MASLISSIVNNDGPKTSDGTAPSERDAKGRGVDVPFVCSVLQKAQSAAGGGGRVFCVEVALRHIEE